MKTTQILIAGFGGQGILFSGKFLAYKGLMEELQVSWLPSYGPEMRGGTANCNVILSDDPVGSPIITTPDVLIAMNLPSFEKFVPTVKAGGIVIADSSLIETKTDRTDIDVEMTTSVEAILSAIQNFPDNRLVAQGATALAINLSDEAVQSLLHSLPDNPTAMLLREEIAWRVE